MIKLEGRSSEKEFSSREEYFGTHLKKVMVENVNMNEDSEREREESETKLGLGAGWCLGTGRESCLLRKISSSEHSP